MRLTAIARRVETRAVLLAIAVAAAYVFLATAGRMDRFPHVGNGYCEQLAVAFADGHLDLVQRPDPAKSADSLRGDYWDLSLYHGRLYSYWGPVPALIGAAVLRWFAISVPDDPMTLAFALVRAAFGTALLVSAKQRFFSGHPWWPTALGIGTLVLGAPMTLVLSRPAVYEVAIVGGQAFVVAGTYAAFVALTRPRGIATRPLLALSGALFALGIACRLSLLVAVAAIVALTVAESASDTPRGGRLRWASLDAAVMAAPLGLCLLALGAYNKARFGSAFDTGLHLQLSQWMFHSGVRFVLPNLYSYIVKPPQFDSHFPFLHVAGWDGFPLWWWMPDLVLHEGDYYFEASAGFLWTTPFYAFAAVAWLALAGWIARGIRRRDLTPSAPAPRLAWLAAVSLVLVFASMAPCLVAAGSSVRYLADGSAGLALGATLGLSLLVARARSRAARGALAALAFAMVAGSIVVNLALWVDGPYGDFLHAHNRQLFDRLSHVFSHGAGA
jgi:hypothetical protein